MSNRITRPSPWGPLAVADAHVHFFSHHFFSTLIGQTAMTIEAAGALLGWQLPPAEPEKLAAAWVHELDRHGVSASALIGSIPGDEGSVIAAERAFPERFFAYAMVNPRGLSADFNAQLSAVRVACLFPAMHGYSVQDECARPVFEWAKSQRRAVFVHCGVLSVGVRKKLGLASPFDLRFSNPVDLHGIALRYPEVPIIVPHFGAGYFREALMLADQCANVYLDTSSSNHWMRYQAGHVTLREVFRHALEVAGPKRLLFGTDSSYFPRGWQQAIFEDQARALYEIGTSEADAKAIFGENLLRILAA
ncbi:MAG TPA: amidohydrolase family protein [Bryobacteraceae bacterium]